MKNILSGLLLAASVFFISCKKTNVDGGNNNAKPQQISFNVGFSKTVTDFDNSLLTTKQLATHALATNAADPSLPNYVKKLHYIIYDATGKLIRNVRQNSTDSVFGTYTDNLPAGTYTVVVIAGGPALHLLDETKLSTASISYIESHDGSYINFNDDTFFAKETVVITTTPVSKNIALDRLVSKLTINLTDALPANLSYIDIVVANPASSFTFDNALPNSDMWDVWATRENKIFTPLPNGNTQLYPLLFLYNNTPLTVTLKAMDKSTPAKVIATKVISNVTAQPNRVTVLTGSLFGNAVAGDGYAVQAETAWNSTVITKTF